MYNGVGLQSSRGSGTNGHSQANKFIAKPNTYKIAADPSKSSKWDRGTAGVMRKHEKEMSEHDSKRQIELKLLVLEEKLIHQGYSNAEISEKLNDARNSSFQRN